MIVECQTPEAADALLLSAFIGNGDEALRQELLDRLQAGTLPALLRVRLNVLLEGAVKAVVRRELLPAIGAEREAPLLDACHRLAHANSELSLLVGILLDALEAADVCAAARALPLQDYRATVSGIAAVNAAIEALTQRCTSVVH